MSQTCQCRKVVIIPVIALIAERYKMSIELCIQQLEAEIKVRDEFILAVQSLILNEIGHCTAVGCTEENPCRDCKDRRHILELIENLSVPGE